MDVAITESGAGSAGGRRRAAAVSRERIDIEFTFSDTPLGRMLVARSARGVCSVMLADADDALMRELRERFPRAVLKHGGEALEPFPAGATGSDLPLDVRGTEFQRAVWDALRRIPAGETATYTDIAARIGRPGAVRAVAGACAANPLALIVPCHRVVRRDGGIAGYRWGVERKQLLLEMEARRSAKSPSGMPLMTSGD